MTQSACRCSSHVREVSSICVNYEDTEKRTVSYVIILDIDFKVSLVGRGWS